LLHPLASFHLFQQHQQRQQQQPHQQQQPFHYPAPMSMAAVAMASKVQQNPVPPGVDQVSQGGVEYMKNEHLQRQVYFLQQQQQQHRLLQFRQGQRQLSGSPVLK
jgi:hypothetical protein